MVSQRSDSAEEPVVTPPVSTGLAGQELDERRQSLVVALLVVASAVFATWGRIGPWADRVPGDVGDTRFNMAVLEHLHLWSRGRVGLFDGLFFWPLDDVILYSDNHLGSGWAYLLPRWMGVGISNSFAVWYFAGVLLSGLAAYAVARRWWFTPATSVVIAGVFLLAFPVTMQANHAQLVHRWYIPWALFEATRLGVALLTDRSLVLRRGRAVSGWLAVGLLCSPGVALLTGLLVLATVAATVGLLWLDNDRAHTAEFLSGRDPRAIGTRRLWDRWQAKGRPGCAWKGSLAWTGWSGWARVSGWASWLGVVGVAGWVALAYQSHASRLGLSRTSADALNYSPTPKSLVTAPVSDWWQWMGDDLAQINVHEHALLFGVVVSFLALWALPSSGFRGRLAHLHAVVAVAGVLLVVKVGRWSIFVLMAKVLPGLDSVRTPGRIALVLAFPVAIACGTGLRRIHIRFPAWTWLLALAVLFLELGSQQLPSSRSAGFVTDAGAYEAELRVAVDELEADAFLLLDVDGVPWFATDTEAMLAAYQTEVPTVNGYSGWLPYDPGALMTCADAETWLNNQPELAGIRVYVVGADCPVITPESS